MPRTSQIPEILNRRKNPRLGSREWRRFPARKGVTGRSTVDARKPQIFQVDLTVEGDLATFTIINRSGHVERVTILGTAPEVSIELDGNTSHSASLPVAVGSTTVEIRHDGRDGELLVGAEIETKESEHGPEAPHAPQQLPQGQPGPG